MKEPSVKETAFSCPHCGAYTTQYWYDGYVKFISSESGKPIILDKESINIIEKDENLKEEVKNRFLEKFKKMQSKLLFVDEKVDFERVQSLKNLFLSKCYNCMKWAVWVNEDLIYPSKKFGSLPNQDLPQGQ